MKKIIFISGLIIFSLILPSKVFAAESTIPQFVSSSLTSLAIIGSLVATFFIIKGGYEYITSSGRPDLLEESKKTIKNALIGLILILSANTFILILTGAFNSPSPPATNSSFSVSSVEPQPSNSGLAHVLLDSIASLLQNIVQSAAKPITDEIISFLTFTPLLATNSVIFKFWLVVVGIADSLFALLVALLGFQFMSATSFGFEELELRQLLPRIGLAFLASNMSIFIIDTIINFSNVLVKSILNATGGLNQIWMSNAFSPASLAFGAVPLITLIFMILFVILAVVLLLFYISRLITLVIGAVLSPFIFLLWAVPKFSDFAEIAVKTYLVTIFSLFVHVIIIQLAASFLTFQGQSTANSLGSIIVGIGILLVLIKSQSYMIQLMFYNSSRGVFRKIGNQIINVISVRRVKAI